MDGKFVDELDGTAHPTAMDPYLVEWKRPETLLADTLQVPVVVLREKEEPEEGEGEAKEADAEGDNGKRNRLLLDTHCLYFGTPCVEWIANAIRLIYERRDTIEEGYLLWENIWPKDEETNTPIQSPNGKYLVRVFIMNEWRTVTVDDRLPVDLFGATLSAASRPIMSWPGILTKAIFKLMKRYGIEHLASTNDVPLVQWLTGWDRENLGTDDAFTNDGALYDRLFDAHRFSKRQALPTAILRDRFIVPKPPRIIALTGPPGIGKTLLLNKLVERFPTRFGRCVATTSRPPQAHEEENREYNFLPRKQFREAIKNDLFLETSTVRDARLGASSDVSYHITDRKPDGKPYVTGMSYEEIRAVAAGGKVLLAETDFTSCQFLKQHVGFEAYVIRADCVTSEALGDILKKRLREDESTIQQRLEFAKAEWEIAQPGGPVVLEESESVEEVSDPPPEQPAQEKYHAVILEDDADTLFYQFKVRCAELSPVVRNRLLGLPSYILDYSDVIPANKTQKPKVKPIVASGPNFIEKNDCLRRVAEEFPEVFVFPQIVTTEPKQPKFPSDDDPEEEEEGGAGEGDAEGDAADNENSSSDANVDESTKPSSEKSSAPGNSGHPWSPLPMAHLSVDEFTAAEGEYACVWESQFAHSEVTYKYGITKSSLESAASDEKLVLINIPSVQTLDQFVSSCEGNGETMAPAGGCMPLFLGPSTIEEHERRLREYLTESPESIASQVKVSEFEKKTGTTENIFDAFLTVEDKGDDFESAVDKLSFIISTQRPDMIHPPDPVAEAAKIVRPLVVCGPSDAGKKQMIDRLLKEYPGRFKKVIQTTTRPVKENETGETSNAGEGEGENEGEGEGEGEKTPRYFFTSKEQFDADVAEDKFLEFVERKPPTSSETTQNEPGAGGEQPEGEASEEPSTEPVVPFMYGVSKEAFELACEGGSIPIMDVDVSGIRNLKNLFPEGAFFSVVPGNVESLERKLRERFDMENANAEGDDNNAATEAGTEAAGTDADTATENGDGEIDAEAAAEALRLKQETEEAAAKALELRITTGCDKIAVAMEDFDEQWLFTDVVVVDETEENGFTELSEKNALDAAFGDFKLGIWNSPLGPHTKEFLKPPPRPLVVAGPLGSRREKTFELLLKEFPDRFGFPIGVTTRDPTNSEIHGVHYEFITQERFDQRVDNGEFMECTEVIVGYGTWDESTQQNPPITHSYGISTREVKRIKHEGKMPIVETDVAGAAAMKDAGLEAVYVFFEHPWDDTKDSKYRKDSKAPSTLKQQHIENLRLAGETVESLDARLAEASSELSLSRENENLFDLSLRYETDELSRYAKLKEIISFVEPGICPVSSVWGFGRARWDETVRRYGENPLRVAVIGPAACGKSTVARSLAARYDAPLIYPGALLRAAAYDAPTALGTEAKRYLDSTRTVPDNFMMKLVLERLAKEDVRRRGYVLDGFPHNHYQATQLEANGIECDKVLVLEMRSADAVERTNGRLIDPVTGITYHKEFAPPGEDEPDVQARLVTRHDDEESNVRNRLAKYDFSNAPVRSVYPHTSFYLNANRSPQELVFDCVNFIELEDLLHDTRVITHPLQLPSLEYEITQVEKYRRASVVKLEAPGLVCETREQPVWVDLFELTKKARQFVLNSDPKLYEHTVCDLRKYLTELGPGGKAAPLGKMIHVDSEEPSELVVSVTLAPQDPAPEIPKPNVLALCGDGAELLALALCEAYPDVYHVAKLQELPPVLEEDEVYKGGEEEEKEEGEDAMDEGEEKTEGEVKDEESPAEGSPDENGFVREAYPGANHSGELMQAGLCPVVWLDASEAAAFKKAVVSSLEAEQGEAPAPAEGNDADTGNETKTKIGPTVVCVGMPPPPKAPGNDSDDAKQADGDEPSEPAEPTETETSENQSPFDAVVYPPSSATSVVPTLEMLKGVPAIASRLELRRSESTDAENVCQVLVHDYDWHETGKPQRIVSSLDTTSHCTRTITLPRGRHTLQLSVDPGFCFNAAVRSNTEFAMDEPSKLLLEKELAAPVVCEGEYGVLQPGEFVVWFRRVFTVAKGVMLASVLEIADPFASPFARFAVVDNDDVSDGNLTHFVAGAAPPTEFQPNEHGYTLIAYAKTLVPLPSGKWRLSCLSDTALASFQDSEPDKQSWEDKETFSGVYSPNYALTVCRFRVNLKQRSLLSLHFETDIPCGLKAVFVDPEDGWETKQAEYLRGGHQGHLCGTEVKRFDAYGALTVPSIIFEETPGDTYKVFEVKLVPERTSFSIDTNGDVPRGINWKLTVYSTNISDTTWTLDDAREQYLSKTITEWNAGDPERAEKAAQALHKRKEERELRRTGENLPPVKKPVKVGKDQEVKEDAEVIELDNFERRRTLRRGGETVDAARAAAAAKAERYRSGGFAVTARTDAFGNTLTGSLTGTGYTFKDAPKTLYPTSAVPFIEQVTIPPETYAAREAELQSSIEASKARLLEFVARRDSEKEARTVLAETKKSSFHEWRVKETVKRRDAENATWRAKRTAYLESVKPAVEVEPEPETVAEDGPA